MHVIIFAGGTGTRLWPLSRRNSPKQFAKIKNGKSTLQMCIDRIRDFGLGNTYISTNVQYVSFVAEQVPDLAEDHIFAEPAKMDLAPAVGLTLMRLKKRGLSGPAAILWSDHFMEYPDRFIVALRAAEQLVLADPNRFVFLGERPRYANHNLGWIHIGKKINNDLREFIGWKYRPEKIDCDDMFASNVWLWNPGYFVFDIDFVLALYKKYQPTMLAALSAMAGDEDKINREYAQLQALHFDTAIIEHIDPSEAVVLPVDLGWSDPGTLYALKEAMQSSVDKNYIFGDVLDAGSKDCLIHNEEASKIIATVGLRGIVVVNTKDALLVCHKDAVPDIKQLLSKLEAEGKDKYL